MKASCARSVSLAVVLAAFSMPLIAAPSQLVTDGTIKVRLSAGPLRLFAGSFQTIGEKGDGKFCVNPETKEITTSPEVLSSTASKLQTQKSPCAKATGKIDVDTFVTFETDNCHALYYDQGVVPRRTSLWTWVPRTKLWSKKTLDSEINPRDLFIFPVSSQEAILIAGDRILHLDLLAGKTRSIESAPAGGNPVTSDLGELLLFDNKSTFFKFDAVTKEFKALFTMPELENLGATYIAAKNGRIAATLSRGEGRNSVHSIALFTQDKNAWTKEELVRSSGYIWYLSYTEAGLEFHTSGVLQNWQKANDFVAITSEGDWRFSEIISHENIGDFVSPTSDFEAREFSEVSAMVIKGNKVFLGGHFITRNGNNNVVWIDLKSGKEEPVNLEVEGRVTWAFDGGDELYFGGDLRFVRLQGIEGSSYPDGIGCIGAVDFKSGKVRAIRGSLHSSDACGRRGYSPWTANPRMNEKGRVVVDTGLNCPDGLGGIVDPNSLPETVELN